VPELKIAVQLRNLRQPFRSALQTAAELGASAVELDARLDVRPQEMSQTAVRQLRKQLEDVRLRVAALSFYTRRGYNVALDLDRRVEATRQAMQLAHALGASVVVNHVGRVPDDDTDPAWPLMVDVLRDLGEYGHRVGALLCAETGSESPAQLQKLIQALPDGSLGVTLNPGNLALQGFSATEAAELLGPHIHYVHVKDGVRDAAQGRGVEVPIGRGSVDFPAVLSALAERAYRGYFAIQSDRGADPAAEMRQAIEFLHNL